MIFLNFKESSNSLLLILNIYPDRNPLFLFFPHIILLRTILIFPVFFFPLLIDLLKYKEFLLLLDMG